MQKYYWLQLALESVFRRASPSPLLVPFALRSHSNANDQQLPRGVTLLELIVAIALLGGMAALVAPAMIAPARDATDLPAIVRSARSLAIARSQPLVLHVTDRGAWSISPLPPGDTVSLGRGDVALRESLAVTIQLSPLGACLPLAPLPLAWGEWDVASCSAASWPEAGRRRGARG